VRALRGCNCSRVGCNLIAVLGAWSTRCADLGGRLHKGNQGLASPLTVWICRAACGVHTCGLATNCALGKARTTCAALLAMGLLPKRAARAAAALAAGALSGMPPAPSPNSSYCRPERCRLAPGVAASYCQTVGQPTAAVLSVPIECRLLSKAQDVMVCTCEKLLRLSCRHRLRSNDTRWRSAGAMPHGAVSTSTPMPLLSRRSSGLVVTCQ
jgi:hypothetical protein